MTFTVPPAATPSIPAWIVANALVPNVSGVPRATPTSLPLASTAQAEFT